MGERLNIEIHRGDRVLANAYYHWSAYTQSALELTQEVVSAIDDVEETDLIIQAVRLLEATEAGMSEEEKERVNQKVDASIFENCINRNRGLISITEEGIRETRLWQDSRVIIDLDEKMIEFDVCCIDELEAYENDEELYEEKKEEFDSYPTYNFDLTHFSFEELPYMVDMINEIVDDGSLGYKLSDGTIISLITA